MQLQKNKSLNISHSNDWRNTMPEAFPPINPKYPHFLHGGDYNPDQWPKEIWDEDMRLMNLAHCNCQTVGIFSWVHLEPEEGVFQFDWLDEIMDKLAEKNYGAVLATPSAAMPAWMSAKYPEILRVGANRVRQHHGNRVNNCLTSSIYREKCRIIARKLAERYKNHPALLVWHVYNEYGGDCHCELCQTAFREWLKKKYGSLDTLNAAWWTAFWGHDFSAWEQIESPGPLSEGSINGLILDWKRYVSDQTIDSFVNEARILREVTPDVPVTTNLMGTYEGINYWNMAKEMDVISWDSYPAYHGQKDMARTACYISMVHDINRSLKGGKPFMLMESTPSSTNWMPISKLKKPGIHMLASMQAVAHGSDTVQYFQWRQSRGSAEKFHGAVVAHNGDEKTRVFRDVTGVGKALQKIRPVLGSTVKPQAALIYDWENEWAISAAQGPRQKGRDYVGTCCTHYNPFWQVGVPLDVIDSTCDFSSYRLLIAPMLYMLRPGVAEKIEAFVANGGTFVTTYWSGITNENDLCFLGGFPGPLRKVMGIWSEEIDVLYDDEKNQIVPTLDNALGMMNTYDARIFCDLIHTETAETMATYAHDFYAGRPALTVNHFGKGEAYYIAFRGDGDFETAFYILLMEKMGISPVLDADLPLDVTCQMRSNTEKDFLFLMNFSGDEKEIDLQERDLTDMLTGEKVQDTILLPGFGVAILVRPAKS
jgi:beta-galactosidase